MLELVIDELATEYELTKRQKQVFGLLATGADLKEICSELSISDETTKEHVKAILSKSRAGSRNRLLGHIIRRLDALSQRTVVAK